MLCKLCRISVTLVVTEYDQLRPNHSGLEAYSKRSMSVFIYFVKVTCSPVGEYVTESVKLPSNVSSSYSLPRSSCK
jgi:hypothetical protein